MLKVGLTGGIGSGKSLVCKIFSLLGTPVYLADIAAKNLYDTDPELKEQIIKAFGTDLYSTGLLNRQKLAEIIFSDKQKLETVNSLVHPAVIKDFERFVSSLPPETPYVLHEAAILYEAGMKNLFDKIINVWAPENLKIERVISRNNTTVTEVKQRIASQWDDEKKKELSDFNIINDNKTLILPQILKIHNCLVNS